MSLNANELRAIDLTVELWNLMSGTIIRGSNEHEDSRELMYHIHAIQYMLMSQSAAREHPDKFRLLGKSIPYVQ